MKFINLFFTLSLFFNIWGDSKVYFIKNRPPEFIEFHGKVPVLMFHKLRAYPKNNYEITPQEFREILKLLRDNNFCPVSLDEIINGKFDIGCRSKKLFSITFDDGDSSNINFLENKLDPNCAYAILKEIFIAPKATFFINIQNPSLPFGKNSAKKLQFLESNGIIIGNHGARHIRLDRLGEDGLKEEIGRVFEWYYKNSINPPSSMVLAYPYGVAIKKNYMHLLREGFIYNGKKYFVKAAFSASLGRFEKKSSWAENNTDMLYSVNGNEKSFIEYKYLLPRINISGVADVEKDIILRKNIQKLTY